MAVPYIDLDKTKTFQRLKALPRPHIADILTRERVHNAKAPMAAGLSFHFAAMPIEQAHLETFQDLAEEMQLIQAYQDLLNGEVMNTGENRKVLHHLTRGQLGDDVFADGVNKAEFYRKELHKVQNFARKVHAKSITGSTGKPFDTVVQIGIGGSDLGPRALCIALEGFAKSQGRKPAMRAEFISNIDPDDGAAVMEQINPETTLFILVTKSGSTQETLTNRELVLSCLEKYSSTSIDASRHMTAVTSETSPLAGSPDFLETFFIDDYIGGRFSSTSAVGALVLSLAYGAELFLDFLSGAHDADRLALTPEVKHNAALLDALIGMYLRNVLSYPASAVLPYSHALSRFTAHLQQLDMESSGKQVNRYGKPVSYATGPLIFGEPGTNSQHSFYQLLHQGTDIIPLQFIGFRTPQRNVDIESEGSTSQQKLAANLAAQIIAFAKGKDDVDKNKYFPGNRPSSLICGDQLTPRSLGALLSHFENKVMFQGLIWNINSFDQEGVQLGKELTKQLLSDSSEPEGTLLEFYRLLTDQ